MLNRPTILGSALALAIVASATLTCRADDLRNAKKGEPAPAFRMPTIDGDIITSESLAGSVVVVVCLSAEQRRSELAAMDSSAAVEEADSDQVKLVHVTADVIRKAYFQKFRHDRDITAPLGFDAERRLYAALGLIVFPTTIVVDPEGTLAHVISLHGKAYKHELSAYIQHALGAIDDEQLKEQLTKRPDGPGSPKSVASAHRALARSMRDKGRLDIARTELERAREQDPTDPEIILDLADLDLTLGNLDAAEALVGQVLDAHPDHRRAKQIHGIALFKRGDLDAARTMLEEALYLNPSPERVHYYLGLICERRGEVKQALQHYHEALRLFLNEPETNKTPAERATE